MEQKTCKLFSLEFKLAVTASCVGREDAGMLLSTSSTPFNFSPVDGQVAPKGIATGAAGVLLFGRAFISAEEAVGSRWPRCQLAWCRAACPGLGRPREPGKGWLRAGSVWLSAAPLLCGLSEGWLGGFGDSYYLPSAVSYIAV